MNFSRSGSRKGSVNLEKIQWKSVSRTLVLRPFIGASRAGSVGNDSFGWFGLRYRRKFLSDTCLPDTDWVRRSDLDLS